MANIIGKKELENARVVLDYYTDTKSNGATGKSNVKVHVDCSGMYFLDQAKLEIQRKLNTACRDSIHTVSEISKSTMQDPYVFNITGESRTRESLRDQAKAMKESGATDAEIMKFILGE